MRVEVFFWFDVEDYITPASDVALGRLVDLFDRHGLRATFKLVGEKVRGLEQRGHAEILSRLRAHDIGYHTDYHSKPPSISEYLLEQDWVGGIAEFMRREEEGLSTLRRAFGRTPSCYGQPGGAWAPQVYPALRQWGIPTYLDAGPWVTLEGRPHFYCGVLNLLGLPHTLHIGIGRGADAVRRCQAQVVEIVDRLRPTGGQISLYAHECEFVTAHFWDGINYAHGRDTPRREWQPAPLLDDQESEARYEAMDAFLAAVSALPDVEIVVAQQAPLLYPDRARGRAYTPQQVAQLCAPMAEAITHQSCQGAWLSPAEIFRLAVRLLAERARTGEWPARVTYQYIDGPAAPPHSEGASSSLSLDDLFGTCLYEDAAMDLGRQMPAEIQVGRAWLSPADLISTLAVALPRWIAGDTGDVLIRTGNFAQGEYVADHVSWDWIIFPPGFNGDALLELGKLQAWTLKPATA